MKSNFIRWSTGLVVALAATTAVAAVSVEEIIRLHKAGLSDQSLLLVVSASATPDTLSTAQLTQMIEAQVPDTVISAMVEKADAVMEDWHPVNLDEAIDGRKVYTETEVNYVYPSWGGWYGYGGWGWCGTPWYAGYPWYGYGCATPYSGLYVGYGWGGGWSVGVNFGWGYGCYDPWYGSGYCGGPYYYDPYPGCGYYPGYDPYPGYGDPYPNSSYRVVDRVDYQSGPSRSTGGGRTIATPYRQDGSTGTRTELSSMQGKNVASIDPNTRSVGGRSIRNDGSGQPVTNPGRSIDDLKRMDAQNKPTLRSADKGEGRYAIKGDEKQLKDNGPSEGRTFGTMGNKPQRGSAPESRSADMALRNDAQPTPDNNGVTIYKGGMPDRVSGATRTVSRNATGAESVGEQVNRYVKMKQAQRASGSSSSSRGNRTTSSNTRLASAPTEVSSGSVERGSSSGRSVKQSKESGSTVQAAPGKGSSAPKSVSSRQSGQRSTSSFGSAPRSGGGSRFSGGGGGARGGGGGARGGGGGGRGGGRR